MTKKRIIAFKNKYRTSVYLFLILLLAFYLRTFNINWDNNFYFHPDERAIIMFAIPLHAPSTIHDFFQPSSPLNPHFFAYGNLPLYLIKALGIFFSFIDVGFTQYGGIHIVGRLISAVADTATVFIIFLLGRKLFSQEGGLFAALIYALSVFPIQSSHFFTVDPLLTFFMSTALLSLLLFIQSPRIKTAMTIGIFCGLSLATKISSLILAPYVILGFILVAIIRKITKIFPLILSFFLLIAMALLLFSLTQPYVLMDFQNFIFQTSLQTKMGNDPFIFPYTLQYVGKMPYIYELKNIILFGQGPIISLICIAGGVIALYKYFNQWKKNIGIIFIILYGVGYFIIFGKFAVGWMRYMLPLYPVLAVFGGYLLFLITEYLPLKLLKNYFARKSLLLLLITLLAIYPISFMSIYLHKNTRIQASDWINKNISPGNTIAIEHWDDSLPIYGANNYTQLTLPLYDPETSQKWDQIRADLARTNFIIIASNRLYTPLQKLTHCEKLPPDKCYPTTATYYKKLFSGKMGFKKVAEFSEYPTIPFVNIKIDDQNADESFTVNDHPKIMIFKKIN